MCAIIFLRLRKACAAQGINVPYQSKFQPYGTYCLEVFANLLLCNGSTLFCWEQSTTNGFLTLYLGISILLALRLGHRVVKGRSDPWLIRSHEMDLTSLKAWRCLVREAELPLGVIAGEP